MSAFDADTAVRALGGGRHAATLHDRWWGGAGLHGGYVAAVVLRAMLAELDDPARPPRSLTLHYARAPQDGPAAVHVTVEKAGRSASTLTARVAQDGRVAVVALGTFAGAFPAALDYAPAPPPELASAPAENAPPPDRPDVPPFAHQLDMLPLEEGLPYRGAERAVAGGWVRLVDPHAIDAPLVALCADAYWPAPFARLQRPAPAPTIDLTLHFRRALPLPAAPCDPHPWLWGRFTSTVAHDGFFEEDGELWTADGELLVHSRQLALLMPGG